MSKVFSLNNTKPKDKPEEEFSPEVQELLKKVLEYITERRMLFSSKEIREKILDTYGVKDLTTEKLIKGVFQKFDVFFLTEFNRQKVNAILKRAKRKEEKTLQLDSFKICNGIYSTEVLKLQEYIDLLNSRTIAKERFLRIATDKYESLSELIKISDIFTEYEKELQSLCEEISKFLLENIESMKQMEQNFECLLNLILERKQTIKEGKLLGLFINEVNNKEINNVINDMENISNSFEKIKFLISKYNDLCREIEAYPIKIAEVLRKLKIKDLRKVELFIKSYKQIMEKENNKNS